MARETKRGRGDMLFRNVGDDSMWAKAQLSQSAKGNAAKAAKAAAKPSVVGGAVRKPRSAQEILAGFRNSWKDKVVAEAQAGAEEQQADEQATKPEKEEAKRDASESSDSGASKKRQKRERSRWSRSSSS
ncbi:CACNA1H [Symbiodinium pilosum]|uniref:CACNA1H protein n=1 Tax=Symbiodinium pilosum TaxID=2952 RepID=A0A812SGR8_SYMPI|nr:CACNA1H [Symbiodinium pilosum]